MFRTQHKVPEAYVNNSRDFQIFCRAKDAVFGAVKYNIDSLRHTANTMEINSSLLNVLKSKVGFFTNLDVPEDQLRIILAGFPHVVRYKGSLRGIQDAAHLWFRSQQLTDAAKILIINEGNQLSDIVIYLGTAPRDIKLLEAIMEYILPTGCTITYQFGDPREVNPTNVIFTDSEYDGVAIYNSFASNIRGTKVSDDTAKPPAIVNRMIGTVGFTQVASKADLNNADTTLKTFPSPDQGGTE